MLWIGFKLINELDEFAGVSAAEIARYYWVTLPGNFFVVVPVALLLGGAMLPRRAAALAAAEARLRGLSQREC